MPINLLRRPLFKLEEETLIIHKRLLFSVGSNSKDTRDSIPLSFLLEVALRMHKRLHSPFISAGSNSKNTRDSPTTFGLELHSYTEDSTFALMSSTSFVTQKIQPFLSTHSFPQLQS